MASGSNQPFCHYIFRTDRQTDRCDRRQISKKSAIGSITLIESDGLKVLIKTSVNDNYTRPTALCTMNVFFAVNCRRERKGPFIGRVRAHCKSRQPINHRFSQCIDAAVRSFPIRSEVGRRVVHGLTQVVFVYFERHNISAF